MDTPQTALSLLLVFWTGSALFVALHPRAFRDLLQGQRPFREPEAASCFRYRIGGLLCALAGLLLLLWLLF